MDENTTYSIDDLESETGVDRRTISYYVQEGLLPRVGRRGPKTRYPKKIRDRLLFIQELRKIEKNQRVPNFTLARIRDLFERLPDDQITRIADKEEPMQAMVIGWGTAATSESAAREPATEDDSVLFSVNDDFDDRQLAADGRKRKALATGGTPESADSLRVIPQDHHAARILELLGRIQTLAQARRHETSSEYISEPWTRANLTSDLVLSVRGRDKELELALDRLAREIRSALRRR